MDIAQLLSGHSRARPVQRSPELTVVKNVARQLLFASEQQVVSADKLPCDIHLTYLLHLSDGSRGVFKCSPGLSTRTLRSEQYALENESRTLNILNRRTQLPIPIRIKFGSGGNELALRPPYLLRSYIPGTPLSQILSNNPSLNRSSIDKALGVHYATLSTLTATSFGTPHAVHAGPSSISWQQGFLRMLEAILRDAEDILISLPYDSIRYYVNAHANCLGAGSGFEPRLTALSFCDSDKILIDEDTMQIAGLTGLDDVLWGDPEMAPIFQDPSSAFLEGYGKNRLTVDGERRKRLLLYSIYHASVNIVKMHYRPGIGEDELLARRSLTESLNQLASIPEESKLL